MATNNTENAVLTVISSGRARSRRDIAQTLGLSMSTVSEHVQKLLSRSLIEEGPSQVSSGGRRAGELHLAGEPGLLGMIDLGGGHARLGIAPRGSDPAQTREIPVNLSDGVEPVLSKVVAELGRLASDAPLTGVGIALPGPVGFQNHGVNRPSRMPGWGDVDVAAVLEDLISAPAMVDNDANAMALGEHFAHTPRANSSITIKAGTAIGSGIVINGRIFRGAAGLAGEITHTRVEPAGDLVCSCGNTGCLETVSSGAALVRSLKEQGRDVHTTADVVALVGDGDPEATALSRTAGRYLGEVMSAIVNFFNPAAIYLSGALSTLEPFVSGFRSQVYEGAHPLMTRDLNISPAALGSDAGLIGIGREINEYLTNQPLA